MFVRGTHPPSPPATTSGENPETPSAARYARGRSRSARFWTVTVVLLVGLVGCAGRQTAGEPTGIELLRRQAAAHPRDAAVQRELALSEMLAEGGDPARVPAQLGRALSLRPHDEVLLLMSALERDVHGDLSTALDRTLEAIAGARTSHAPEAPYVAEVGAGLVSDLMDTVPHYDDRVWKALRPLVHDPGNAGPAARALTGGVLMQIAFRRGDMAAVRALESDLGCIPKWRVAGPFGPRDLLGFDHAYPPQAKGPMADSYDLGPERGVQPTRDFTAQGCVLDLGSESALSDGGTTYAKAFVDIEPGRAGDYVLRLRTPNAVEVYLDGKRVVRLDARRLPEPNVTYHTLELAAGRHELTVKISARHPNPVVDVALTRGKIPAALDGDAPLDAYLRAVTAYARGDIVGAREELRGVMEHDRGSPVMLVLASSVALSDWLRPSDVRRDDARHLLEAAAKRDPKAWQPAFQLARLSSADGQVVRAIRRLRKAVATWPDVLDLRLSLQDMLLDRGWEAESYNVIQGAYHRFPEACPAIQVALSAAQRRDKTEQARKLIDQLVACNATSNAKLSDLLSRRQWDAAEAELERLAKLEPPRRETQILLKKLEIAHGRGDSATVHELLRQLAGRIPRSDTYPEEMADAQYAAGHKQQALDLLDHAIASDPSAMAQLRWARHVMGGENDIDRWRVDGTKVLERFKASGHHYDAPQVLVWDYMAVRVFPDDSSFQIIHQIYKVNSQEAVNKQGEFHLPSGARLLQLYTIKPDGTRLEPDQISGKSTISLPNLAPGDFVESEFVMFQDSPGGMPGAVLGDRFYFQNFDTPFDHSELKVIVPKSMPLTVDPRGPAPKTVVHDEGNLRVYDWSVNQNRPLVPEPMSVAPKEWIQSIRWGIHAKWDLVVNGLLDALVDKDVADPAARRLAERVLGDARNGDALTKAKRLYHWVLANVEDSNAVFGQAASMLAQRTGDRSRILRYMLGLTGVKSKLVLSRSIASDQTRGKLADDDTFTNLLLMVEPGGGHAPVFLSMADRGAPFGYLPPGLRGQEALVIAPGAPRVTVPKGRPGEDRSTAELTVQLAADGSASFQVVQTFRGAGAVGWRGNLEGVPDAILRQKFDEQYVAHLVPGAHMTDLKIEGRKDPEKPFVLRYSFDVPAFGRRQGGAWIVPALLPPKLTARYATLAKRTTTEVVAPPFEQDLTLELQVPSGIALPVPWKPVKLEGPGGASLVVRAERKGQQMVIERRTHVPLMRVAPDAYRRWAIFCRSADEAAERELAIRMH